MLIFHLKDDKEKKVAVSARHVLAVFISERADSDNEGLELVTTIKIDGITFYVSESFDQVLDALIKN